MGKKEHKLLLVYENQKFFGILGNAFNFHRIIQNIRHDTIISDPNIVGIIICVCYYSCHIKTLYGCIAFVTGDNMVNP